MTARSFNLDTEAAKQANSGGKRITESGKYIGTIKSAWHETYPSGAEAVLLKFDSDQGQEAGPLMLFTHGKDGNTLSGYNTVQALMTCVKARSLTPRPGQVELYDFDQQKEVMKQKDTYPELTGKRVGLLLREEHVTDQQGYPKTRDDGSIKTRMILFAPFCAETERTAAEVLEKVQQGSQLERMVQWLAENPVKAAKKAPMSHDPRQQSPQQGQAAQGSYQNPPASAYDDLDDEIPF